jgi:uncharacterized linocin/CFP29 family protein
MWERDDVLVQAPSVWAQALPARFLESGFNVNVLRPYRPLHAHALLHKAEWEQLDSAVVQVAAEVLTGIADLNALGLVHNLGHIGVLLSQYERIRDLDEAAVNMAIEVDDPEDRVDLALTSVPVPIISKSFRIDMRQLAASRFAGSGIDTMHAEVATRKVAEKLEDLLFNGHATQVQGHTIYGYRTHPDRNTGTGADWGTSSNIIPTVLSMVAMMPPAYSAGPFRLYLHPTQFWEAAAVNPNTDRPILRTIEEIPGFGPGSVRLASKMVAGEAVLVSMRRDVVDLARAQDIVPTEWDEKGGLVSRFKVWTAQVPRVKSTAAAASGVVHFTGI